ncbi:sugar epimerase [Virgibacillus profundi]|uniref:Sugar epimerase n=1 Tax=Virgibacillus profundi TaxID=2024555 RepID=A0A2A2IIK4_9BACI|nr:SDR family oxidoreductase [Virgibacillus profundi]PAV31629.1 sugar epimerase [Virgibacillus profundi]PXY55815.1 SDR family NAD(P)-dependent oxidoreductase [Virgibacillus profundi]
MKVLLIGANGQIGKHVVDLLQNSTEHTLRAMVRKEDQAETLKKSGVEAVVANLEGSVDEIAEAASGCDAVIFTAGSGGSTGADKTLLVDLDGAIKSIEAAEKAGANRFVIVSAFQAHNRYSWADNPIKPYMVAKHYADKALEASDLTYTIIRPGGLLNEAGTGKISAAENIKSGSIPREDVAKVVVESLNEEKTHNRSFDLMSGETSISDALKNI